MLGQSEFNVLVDGRAASKITQGVTTEITGEGSSIAPLNDRLVALKRRRSSSASRLTLDFRTLGEYFARLDTRSRPAINLGTLRRRRGRARRTWWGTASARPRRRNSSR